MADRGFCIENLTITHRQQGVLLSLSARVLPGDVMSVMGPSGIGKSTLLAAITGTLPAPFSQTGRIQLNGRDLTALPPQARRVGILFQDHLLFPHLSVGENLAFGLAPDLDNRRQRVCDALADVDLVGFEDRDPATLSGGQRARVALMRMLLAEPEALLLDEPFSRLDAELRTRMRDLVFSRAKAANLPVILVTHDREDAVAAKGQIVELAEHRA
ncbi:ATP-binding cassette domain-containing protein [Phaeobacter sp.]|uniref:ATP-binding cassette domain-containing protein n=1 Tax=Phaeobacter sp. TaxID=1902409 RepID=UPI0025FD6B1E|nr:ATP-binding cassette domain-containing protein [Phaeobacter sp.]